MSTYDTDIIYVQVRVCEVFHRSLLRKEVSSCALGYQEHDLDTAISCLQSKLSRGVHGLKEVCGFPNHCLLGSYSNCVDLQ